VQEYTRADMAQVVDKVKVVIEKFNLSRSQMFAMISGKLAELEKKIDRVMMKSVRVAHHFDEQRRTIVAQRAMIVDAMANNDSLQKVLDQFVCCVCVDRDKDTAFGCGHMVCQQCANSLQLCPICRDPITSTKQFKYAM